MTQRDWPPAGIKWYYSDDAVAIAHADCREILPLLPDKSVDLVLTDPPYGRDIARTGVIGGDNLALTKQYIASDWDRARCSPDDISKLFAVGKNQIIFGGNYIADLLPASACWIIWDKRAGLPSNNFADCELIWTSFSSPARILRYLWQGMLQEHMGDKEYRWHPTQKPMEIVGKLIDMFSHSGDVILDPFLGSGTTLVCAKKLGHKAIGIEIEEKYCAIAADRCRQMVMNLG